MKKRYNIIWTKEAMEHIRYHQVDKHEIEEIIMHQKDEQTPEDLMKGDWEEGWIEVEGVVGEVTSCPRCGSKIEKKKFDIDFLDGKITVHGFEQMRCTKCGFIFMNSEQAQLYEDLYKHFIKFYEE